MTSATSSDPARAEATGSRYDYRTAWLRFLDRLSAPDDASEPDLADRILDAVLSITDCAGAALWRRKPDGGFHWRASRGRPAPTRIVVVAPEVAAALAAEDRPVWSRTEFAPALGGVWPDWLAGEEAPWALVRLAYGRRLLALLVLYGSAGRRPLDAEDRALLGILGTAAASYLAEAEARQSLEDMRALDAFNRRAAFVLHDIKNVAAKLSLALDNARRLQNNPEFYEDLVGTIAHSVRRLEALRARLEVSPGASRSEPVPLHRLVRQACARAGRLLRLEEPLPELWLRGDPALLEAAIGNLLANAREAAGEQGWIDVRLFRREGRAVIEIRDTGPGIAADLAAAGLFRPFASGRRGGTGLGLFGVRDAVRRTGGQIEVERGDGTTVRVILPLLEGRR